MAAGTSTTFSTMWQVICTVIYAVAIGGWLTHIIVCAMDDRYLFLLAGAIFFPMAVIHGIFIWVS